MIVTAPSAPPLRGTAPVADTSPHTTERSAGVEPLDIDGVAAAIAGSSKPTALLTHLLLSASAKSSESAQEQGAMLSKVADECADMLKRLRATLLASVNETPGSYPGFEVIARAGSRRVDYDRLQQYPDVFGEVVTTGNPTLVVRYTND